MATTYASAASGSIPAFSPVDVADYEQGMDISLPTMPEPSAIEKLKPGSELHSRVQEKLRAMFRFSQGEMSNFYDRMQWMEKKIQAYITLPDYKQAMTELNNAQGLAPEPVKVIVPYAYATTHAAATFLYNVLFGRRPVFPLMATSGTTVDKARYMEQGLQSNIELSKGYEVGWQFIWDSLVYTFGALRIGWEERNGRMLRIINGQRQMVNGLKYAGNRLRNIDPYLYLPDPRVPLHQVAEEGDFAFWVTRQSKLKLKDMERAGLLKWVDAACYAGRDNDLGSNELPMIADSQRRARIGQGGLWVPTPQNVVGFHEIREGTVRLSPKDWGLGDKEDSELWKFTWTSKQIMQAEPLGMVHEKHPVVVCEPTSLGHEFGSVSFTDMIGVFQDMLSWLLNSRMENVRTTINNQFIADPARIEMQDLRTPAAGKVIRLKQTAIGTPIKDAIQQLVVADITQGHFGDIQQLRMLADSTTGINDNMRGIQTQGGRRSATEARMSMQAGASRLSQMAIRISSQAMSEMADQMITNIQQFMPNEMWVQITGDDGTPVSSLLTPDMIVGSFNYQISDGSLPHDKMALLEVWKEILFGVAQDPELRARKDLVKIFDYVAELGGAKNISSFDKQVQAQPAQGPQVAADPSAGGAVPIGAGMPQMPFPVGA